MEEYYSECFVLFKPKDKVSGDFYWWAVVEKQLVITVADCTGHGVPGAFMSMLGSSLLREIVVKEYMTNPAIILKRLRKEIINSLKQKGETGEQKDGMDMSLITI
ncbi:MAG: serine/threonine protein kinase, partial [Bacteroidetes bacterium CG_4_8_14_3_um_filter_31_14]